MPDDKRKIKVPHQSISPGVRLQDILADAVYPVPQIISSQWEKAGYPNEMRLGKERYERALRRSWGEDPDDVEVGNYPLNVAEEMADDDLWNKMEATPVVGDILQTTTHGPIHLAGPEDSRVRRAFKPLATKYGKSLAKMAFRGASIPAAIGGSLFDPMAKVLGTLYGSRGIEGGTIIPGGDPEAHQRAREQRRREAQAIHARLKSRRTNERSGRGPDYYALGGSEG